MTIRTLLARVRLPLTIAAVTISVAGLGVVSAHAQILLAATGTVYESSQNTAARQAANLFDGTPVLGSAANLGGLFDGSNNATGGGTDNDYAPIAAFDLGSSRTLSGIAYSQITGIGGTFDFVGVINVYTLTSAQYTSYISSAPLIASQTTGKAGGLVAPPAAGNFVSTQNLNITDQTDSNFTQYNFATPVTGEFFVFKFNNANTSIGATPNNFIGGEELRLVVPEPGSLGLLGLGLGAAAVCARRRLSA